MIGNQNAIFFPKKNIYRIFWITMINNVSLRNYKYSNIVYNNNYLIVIINIIAKVSLAIEFLIFYSVIPL